MNMISDQFGSIWTWRYFFFRVDILRGIEEGDDALEVAADDVTGVEGLFGGSNTSPIGFLVSILPFSSNLNPFTINMLFSTFGTIFSLIT